MAYCYRCGKIFHEESLESHDDSVILCTITFCKRCMEECDMIVKEVGDNEYIESDQKRFVGKSSIKR